MAVDRVFDSFQTWRDFNNMPAVTERTYYQSLPQSSVDEPITIRSNFEPTYRESLYALWSTHRNFNIVLIIFFPLGIIAGVAGWSEPVVFGFNMIAIVTLAKMLDLATEQLALRLGQTLGALINASFGNAVELIVGIMALNKGLIDVVQSSLLGSVLSNVLFVLGCCFFFGGLKNPVQKYSTGAANINSSLLALTVLGFLLPAAFNLALPNDSNSWDKQLAFSHSTSIGLLSIYFAYIYFQLVSHPHIFVSEGEEEGEVPEMNLTTNIAALVGSTLLIGISAEYLVGSIEGLSAQYGLSEAFIGLIILPIVGNAAEHVTAVFAALRNQMDLAIGVSLGSSLQIAIFVTPFLVIIGWITGHPLSLAFPIFDVAVLYF
jgi:Ca2+:H+ antiporter